MFRGMPCFAVFFLCLVCACFSASEGAAAERILQYDVVVQVREDASFLVTERIRVNVEGRKIRRGITRSYPVRQRLADGTLRHYGFTMLSARLDGEEVPFHIHLESLSLFAGVAVGRSDRLVPHGEHVYELRYTTDNHVRFFENHAEIYYNGIGFENAFPVEEASFRLELPGNAAPTRVTAFTGKRGETGRDFRLENGSVTSSRTLMPGEGMTVVFAFDKNLVSLPPQSWANWAGEHRTLLLAAILGMLILYYLMLGHILKKSQRRHTVIPIFSPPKGMSPGFMASLRQMRFSALMLQADIMWLAVNGYLRMNMKDKKNVILEAVRIGRPARSGWILSCCDVLFSMFFPFSVDRLDLSDGSGRAALGNAYDRLQNYYGSWRRWTKHSFLGGLGAVLFGGMIIAVMPFVSSPASELGGISEFFFFFTFLLFLMGLFLFALYKVWVMRKGWKRLALSVAFLALEVGCMHILSTCVEPVDYIFVAVYAVGLGIAWVWSTHFLCVRTKRGAKEYAQVQGLEMYIRTAEKERLAKINAPEDTLEKYEEILPYALALGCADAWQKRFAPLLAEVEYRPDWCATPDPLVISGGYTNILPAVQALSVVAEGAATAAAAAAAAAAMSSSGSSSSRSGGSGFSSGGSSGGGSGGGGVGGW